MRACFDNERHLLVRAGLTLGDLSCLVPVLANGAGSPQRRLDLGAARSYRRYPQACTDLLPASGNATPCDN